MTPKQELHVRAARWVRLVFASREPGVCRVCGCTEKDPCYNPQYGNCWWYDYNTTLCSHCAEWLIFHDPRTVHCIKSAKSDYNLKARADEQKKK
jgi:hypothetical protein